VLAQFRVAAPRRRRCRFPAAGVVIGGRGDRDAVGTEHPANRRDPEPAGVTVDVLHDQPSRRSSSAAAKNGAAVFKMSLANRSCFTSARSRRNSAASALVTPGRCPASTLRLADPVQHGLRGANAQLIGHGLRRGPSPRCTHPAPRRPCGSHAHSVQEPASSPTEAPPHRSDTNPQRGYPPATDAPSFPKSRKTARVRKPGSSSGPAALTPKWIKEHSRRNISALD